MPLHGPTLRRPAPRRYTRTAPLSDGTHTFYVKAIDAAGNESAIISRQFVTDTTPPQTTITGGPAAGSSTADRDSDLHLLLQRGELDLPVPLRHKGVRRLLRARRKPHSVPRADSRPAHIRGQGHGQGQERRRDARHPLVHGSLS